MMARLPRSVLFAALCLGAGVQAPARIASAAASEAGSTRNFYLMLIRQARADGRPRAALAYLADFDRRYPGDLEARILRVNCLLDLGQTAAAGAAVARLPESGETSAIRGHVLAAQGQWSAAITHYRAALAESPADPLVGNALGYALLRAGRPTEAVETLSAAADLAPANAVIRNNLLLALTLAGRADEVDAALAALPDAASRATLRRQLAAEARRLAGHPPGKEG